MAPQLNSVHLLSYLSFITEYWLLCCVVKALYEGFLAILVALVSVFNFFHLITFTNTSWFFWSIFHALKFALFFLFARLTAHVRCIKILTWLWGFLVIFLYLVKSLPGIARQRSLEKFAILSLKPQRHVRFLIYWSLRLGRCYVEYQYGTVLWDELERRSVTSRYHGSKISGSQQ